MTDLASNFVTAQLLRMLNPLAARRSAVFLVALLFVAAIAIIARPASLNVPAPGTLDTSLSCENNDCMREFDGCWFYGIEENCPEDSHELVGFKRQQSACFNTVFWDCIKRFGERAIEKGL